MPRGNGRKVFQNGRVRVSENPLLSKGNENTGENSQSQLFRNLGISQILAPLNSINFF